LRKAGDYEGALDYVREGLAALPESYDIYAFASQLLGSYGRLDTLKRFIDEAPFDDKHRLYFNWGISARVAGRIDDAIKVLEMTHQLYPDYVDAFRALATTYYQNKKYSKLRKIVIDWVARHPEDLETKELLRQIESVDPSRDTTEGTG
jgi:tetratricopeptide (TPR) repeat protein